MEKPDHLKTPVRNAGARPADLGDLLEDELLWDAASWDPDVEPPVPAIPGREPAELAERQRNGGPEPVYLALRRLARLGKLRGLQWPGSWPSTGGPGPGRPSDPMPPDGPAAGPATGRVVGVQEALKTPGVRLLCVTGPAGIGKTRLAMDIATESRLKMLAAGHQERAVPVLTIRFRSVQRSAGQRPLVMTPNDALMDLLLALGVAEHDIPATQDQRRIRYLEELHSRRPIIVVDDVLAENQVELLRPAEAGVVVMTSRRGVKWSNITGVVSVPAAPLDARSTAILVGDVFRASGAEPDLAAVTALYHWCLGTPRPVILISRWLAATGQPTASLDAARRDWVRMHGESAGTGLMYGFPAVAAMLSLLGDDQQAIAAMFGLLRLPEADLAAVCAATGLSRVRALTGLRQLTDAGLLAGAEPAGAWAMPPAVADYTAEWARAADPGAPDTYQRMLDRLVGLYERRIQGLLAAQAVLAELNEPAAAAWAAGEVLVAREVVAAVLDAAAVSEQPGRALGLASGYLTAAAVLDGRPAGGREADRFIGPVLAVAKAAGDHELAVSAAEWLGPEAAEEAGEVAGLPMPSGEPEQGGPATSDSLRPAEIAAEDRATGDHQPVLFGGRA